MAPASRRHPTKLPSAYAVHSCTRARMRAQSVEQALERFRVDWGRMLGQTSASSRDRGRTQPG